MEKIARAGVFVTLDRHGELAVYRGFVQPEDEPREGVGAHGSVPAADGQGAELSTDSHADSINCRLANTFAGQALGANMADDENDGALKPLPERLVMDLTAHRTLALREAVGRSTDVALTLLLLKLVNENFRMTSSAGNFLEASVRQVYMSAQASDLKASVAAKLADERHTEWEADLELVEAGLKPTVDTYLNRVPKARILEAVREAKAEGTAQLLDHLNKGDMATEAEHLL